VFISSSPNKSGHIRHDECQFTRKCEAALLVIASVNLRVLAKQPMVHPIVGEHWRVFDTMVDTPEESKIPYGFPEISRKKERRGNAQKIFTERITRTILYVISRSPFWETDGKFMKIFNVKKHKMLAISAQQFKSKFSKLMSQKS